MPDQDQMEQELLRLVELEAHQGWHLFLEELKQLKAARVGELCSQQDLYRMCRLQGAVQDLEQALLLLPRMIAKRESVTRKEITDD